MHIAPDTMAASGGAAEELGGALAHLGLGIGGALLDSLGPQGTTLALAAGDVAWLVKSPRARAAHIVALKAAHHSARAVIRGWRPVGLAATKDERRIMRRLTPAHWRSHAERRGLEGTLTGRPKLTPSGIVCNVRLDGKWTTGKLRQAEDNIRALLGCRTGLRIEIHAGKRGGWAQLHIRTRSAADGDNLKWSPERTTFGVDTVTGEQVTIPLGHRLLIAGMSGAGKSVASRPLLHDASESDHDRLVVLDLKRVEGRLWDHRARVASTPEAVVAVVGELVAEMHQRLETMPKGQAKLRPTAERPRLTVVVDEGAEVVAVAPKALPGLETLARMGRAACIDLWWMTQKPTINDGIPKQIAPQLSTRICLAVSTPTEARVVLGEDAQAKGWDADQLEKPGFALVRDGKRKPHPVKVRYMTDEQVLGLPARPIWHGSNSGDGDSDATVVLPRALSLVKQPDTETKVLSVVAEGPARQKDIAQQAGLPKGTVSKVVARLIEAGRLVRLPDGKVSRITAEVAQ